MFQWAWKWDSDIQRSWIIIIRLLLSMSLSQRFLSIINFSECSWVLKNDHFLLFFIFFTFISKSLLFWKMPTLTSSACLKGILSFVTLCYNLRQPWSFLLSHLWYFHYKQVVNTVRIFLRMKGRTVICIIMK